MGPVLHRLYKSVWDMQDVEHSLGVLKEIREGLEELEVGFSVCGIFAVDVDDDLTTVRWHDMLPDSPWREVKTEEDKEAILKIWEAETTVYRGHIEGDDPLQETRALTRHGGDSAHSMLAVPYSHGTLAVYSREPEAFHEGDVKAVEQVAMVLSTLFHRLEDLDKLSAKDRQLRQVQRLQLVGQLAAEVAHEINNPLSVVIGECGLLLDEKLEPLLFESITRLWHPE